MNKATQTLVPQSQLPSPDLGMPWDGSTLGNTTITKLELADLLFERLPLNKREAKELVEAFFELVHASLVKGDEVKLSNFGNFIIRHKSARPGRNPRTKEPVPIKARRVVTFHCSQKLKAQIQGIECGAKSDELAYRI